MKGEKNMDEHPNIVMSGYYGFQNAGDDAVCYAIIEALRQEMPACDITVLSNDPELTEKTYGVSACDRWKLKEVWRALRRTDLLVSGGGSLLHGIAPLLEKHTRIHTVIAEDPVNCVAIGTGKSFQYLDKLVDGFVIPSMQRV